MTTDSIDPLTCLVLDSAFKGAVVFAAAGVVALALQRGTAAMRHLVWSLAVAAVLGLPVLSACLPTWTLPLPARPAAPIARADLAARDADVQALDEASRPVREVAASRVQKEGMAMTVPATAPAGRVPSSAAWRWPRMTPRWRWVVWTWAVGAAVSLLPTGAGLLSLWHLGRSTLPVPDGPAQRLLVRLSGELGVSRRVRLVRSSLRVMPMTWGAWRPLILLPGGSESWTEERLEMVILHELAHVKRGDFVTGVLGRLACALYWFNPLAWIASARIRVEQEQACDDLALGRGVDPSDYAGQLLDVLSLSPGRGVGRSVAPAMASSARIERRLRSILDPTRSRRPLARRQVVLAALAAACLAAPLATGRPGSAAAAPPDEAGARRAPAEEQADVLEQLRRNYVRPLDAAALRDGALKGMVGALHDPYSAYLGPAEIADLETQIRGTLTGIGARLGTPGGRVTIEAPLPDSPAQKAGVAPGDVILEVDGVPAAGLDLRAVVQRIVGAPGSVVRLKLARRDGREVVLDITRSTITIPTVLGHLRDGGDRREWMIDPAHKVGYAQVDHFGSATAGELAEAIRMLQAQGMTGMVLDLRSCPGGLLEAAVDVASLFLQGGTVLTTRGRDGAEVATKADPEKSLGDFPLVVLINERTASAGEIVAGALQDRARAVLVGTRTVGKGSVQSLIRLKDGGGAIRLTTAYYTLPGGRNIDKAEGKSSWGVDPSDGDFVPMEIGQLEALRKRRPGRDIPGAIDLADVQLAAALKAIVARLTTGEFAQVGQANAVLAAHIRRRDEIEKRRTALLNDLEELDKELNDLNNLEPR
jgi:carboxyl-terminal processing protease